MFDVPLAKYLRSMLALWATPLLLGTSVTAATIPSSPTDVPSSAYEHAQTLVALPDGRRLNLFCMGTGTPVVVLEAGGGDDSLTFRRVQGRLSSVTRICSYDRAGMGFSDPPDAPNTAAQTIRDLHALVERAVITKPFVLVGHSDGGLYASLYTAYFPDDVAGLVMIDPNNLGLDMAAERVLDQPWLNKWRASDQADIRQASDCVALARKGALARAPKRYLKCLDNPPNEDPALHRLLNAQLARPSEQEAQLTELIDTYPQADGGLANAELTLQRAHFDFGDKPLIVLSGTNEVSDMPISQRVEVTKAMLANQADLAARSTQGKQILVSIRTEYIQTYQPNVVVNAVTEVIEKVRNQATTRSIASDPKKKMDRDSAQAKVREKSQSTQSGRSAHRAGANSSLATNASVPCRRRASLGGKRWLGQPYGGDQQKEDPAQPVEQFVE